MGSAREEILARIRGALRDVPSSERRDDVPVAREYRRTFRRSDDGLLERFADRLSDYKADIRRISADTIADAVTHACRRLELRRVVVAPNLPQDWRPRSTEIVEDHGLTAEQLDTFDAALTGCAVAIAETGTIALDGQGVSGRRAITLVPDHHICVIHSSQVVASVPEAIAVLANAVTQERSPVTFISGPSATSDIELERVEGVHGPRNLLALLVD